MRQIAHSMVAVVFIGMVRVVAQPESPPRFDVTSVKTNKSADPHNNVSNKGGRFTATNVTVLDMMWFAYRLEESQLVNLPPWTQTERFDIAAVARTEPESVELRRALLASLLEDRFSLRAHRETRERPIYDLLLVDARGKLGENVKKSPCDVGKCGGIHSINSAFRGDGITLDRFAEWLSGSVSRTVHNKTNLDGPYDINLACSAILPSILLNRPSSRLCASNLA